MSHRLAPFVLLGVAGLALAAGWPDYKNVFPLLPCQDGWAGCQVNGAALDPGTTADAAGRPHPSDMRVAFFDLAPLPGFSPFASLSEYRGSAEPPAPEPVAEPVAEAPPPEPVAEPVAEPVEAAPREVASAPRTETSAPRSTPTTSEPASTSSSMRPTSSPTSTTSAPPSTTSSPSTTARTTAPTETTARTTTPTTAAPTTSAPTTTAAPTTTGAAPTTTAAPATAAMEVADSSCDDLVALEAPAMMGQLGIGRRRCLEDRLGSESSQTMKNKVSRILMSDAEARRDQGEWERLIKNHLENIDRSDPNLCMKYAIHLSRGGEGKASGVIRWSEYALENKQQWSGTTYTKNVYALLKLRAQAANKQWQAAEADFVANRNDETSAKAEKYRGVTKNYALEWLQYAKASSQDTKAPMALCVSAAGNTEFCEG